MYRKLILSSILMTATVAFAQKPVDDELLLLEAAKKRYKIANLTIKGQGKTEKLDSTMYQLDHTLKQLLRNQLVAEYQQKYPKKVIIAVDKARSFRPLLVKMSQGSIGASDPLQERQALVRDTRACTIVASKVQTLTVDQLETKLCMHPQLDYPGGFDPSRPIQVTILPFSEAAMSERVAKEWDGAVLAILTEMATIEFLRAYRSTGQLAL